MKKLISYIIFITSTHMCTGQQIVNLNLSLQNKVSGTITIPTLQNINVSTQNAPLLDFLNAGDFLNGKEILAYYSLNVNSNIPWIITAKTETDNFNNLSGNGNNIPAEIMSIKNNTDNKYIALSSLEKNIIISNNNNISNDYKVDLKINPSWNYAGGLYNINIIFTLTPQ